MYRGKADESPPRPKPARSASRFGSRESLLFAPAPLKSLTNAEKVGSRLVERRAEKSLNIFMHDLFEKIADFGCAVTIFTQKSRFFVKKVKKIWSCQKKVVPLHPLLKKSCTVVLAQLVEHRIVVPSVKGSSPLFHPPENQHFTR